MRVHLSTASSKYVTAGGRRPRPGQRCMWMKGFVGDGSKAATEFHTQDFDWEELYHTEGAKLEQRATLSDRAMRERMVETESEVWDAFYVRHGEPHFFKERRYLALAFPCLQQEEPPIRILDMGSGYGSSILPLLKANATCQCLAVDVSPTSLTLLHRAAERANICSHRVKSFCMDITHPSFSSHPFVTTRRIDYVLMVFVLSALHPDSMHRALRNAYAALPVGGKLLFRDYGFCDMSQLRYRSAQTFSPHLYKRDDGTLAYYFKKTELLEMARMWGFSVEMCDYHCLVLRNRKSGCIMRRVFVHGIFHRTANTVS